MLQQWLFFFFFFWEAQVTWTDLMNQATQRSEQKHRQPGKPELAAGTRETPQRCCNLGGKLGLLEQGPTAAHPSQDSQAWSAETQGAARKAQRPTGKQAQGWSLRPPVALKTQSEPIVGHTTATSQSMHQRGGKTRQMPVCITPTVTHGITGSLKQTQLG